MQVNDDSEVRTIGDRDILNRKVKDRIWTSG